MKKDVRKKAAKIRLLALDVDGVLTDGRIFIGEQGEIAKVFHVHDGLGMAAAQRAGLRIALITGRNSPSVTNRAAELGITDVYQGVKDKTKVLAQLAVQYALVPEEIAYAGDDLNDLPALAWVGLPCAVANAVDEVRRAASWVTRLGGGQGAVRELVEGILVAQDRWETIVAGYQEEKYNICQ
ncbi:MAG TPA: HAD hydrolase family protein [Patescibacteria group bacterium]|nr:HAD hydrolase family protein [Patescibacteria group bacterium]